MKASSMLWLSPRMTWIMSHSFLCTLYVQVNWCKNMGHALLFASFPSPIPCPNGEMSPLIEQLKSFCMCQCVHARVWVSSANIGPIFSLKKWKRFNGLDFEKLTWKMTSVWSLPSSWSCIKFPGLFVQKGPELVFLSCFPLSIHLCTKI